MTGVRVGKVKRADRGSGIYSTELYRMMFLMSSDMLANNLFSLGIWISAYT